MGIGRNVMRAAVEAARIIALAPEPERGSPLPYPTEKDTGKNPTRENSEPREPLEPLEQPDEFRPVATTPEPIPDMATPITIGTHRIIITINGKPRDAGYVWIPDEHKRGFTSAAVLIVSGMPASEVVALAERAHEMTSARTERARTHTTEEQDAREDARAHDDEHARYSPEHQQAIDVVRARRMMKRARAYWTQTTNPTVNECARTLARAFEVSQSTGERVARRARDAHERARAQQHEDERARALTNARAHDEQGNQ